MSVNTPTQAPVSKRVIEEVMRDHPEIDRHDEEGPRGRQRILDYACARLNRPGQSTPWGRKARERIDADDPSTGINLNTDGLTFLRADGRFEIIDVISGVDGSATWDHKGVFEQGSNGWWAPALSVDERDKPGPVPSPGPRPDPPMGKTQPRLTYSQQLDLCRALARVLGAPTSRYQGHPEAIGEVVGHLLWKVQFEGYEVQHAIDNANRRARGEEAD